MTKYHRRSSLNNRQVFHSSGAEKFTFKVLADSVPDENVLPSLQRESERETGGRRERETS